MKKIILFDGVCLFCQKSVQFIIKRDKKAVFQFASLQSSIGRKMLQEHRVPTNENSLILLEDGCYYSKSTAALKVSKHLTHFWRLLYLFIIVPKPIRDFVYNFIAHHRYKLLNENTTCMIPTPEIRKRFLQ